MTHRFDDSVLTAVLGHMNVDHPDDNILIMRAFSVQSDIASAVMTGFDGDGGDWQGRTAGGEDVAVRVLWPGGPIDERAHVRREIVALYDEACLRLDIEPRAHA